MQTLSNRLPQHWKLDRDYEKYSVAIDESKKFQGKTTVLISSEEATAADPVKTVPADEAWVYENPDRIASIQRGIAQAEAGKLISIELETIEDGEEE